MMSCEAESSMDAMLNSGAGSCEDWNKWREIYEEEWGHEETERRLKTQFEFPKPTFASLCLHLSTWKLAVIFPFLSRKHHKRPSHAYGVGAAGFAFVLNNPNIPETDFFTPERAFHVRMWHGNFRLHDDDASCDGRSLSIKFDDVTSGGPLDLVMNTGRVNFFQNLPTFERMTYLSGETDEDVIRKELFDRPINLRGTIDYLRRSPDSYTLLHYHALTTYILVLKDGSKRHVRFRIIPEDVIGKDESGLPSIHEQKRPCDYLRRKDDIRSKTYLRDAFKKELASRTLRYFLEIQIHDAAVKEADHEIFNSSVTWDYKLYPWHRMAEITITTALSDSETESTYFDTANRPKCLEIPKPESKWDYNSIPCVMEQVYKMSKLLRRHQVEEKTIMYSIIARTKIQGGAGTDSDVLISIIGRKCRTRPHLLDYTLRNDFEQGSVNVYVIKAVDVGEMLAVEIFNKNPSDDLLLDYVVVYHSLSKVSVEFPCVGWIGPRRVLTRGKAATSKDKDSNFLREFSRYQQANNRQVYMWKKLDGLPSAVEYDDYSDLPLDARFTSEKALDFYLTYIWANFRVSVRATISSFNSLDSYYNFAHNTVPKNEYFLYYYEHWKEDQLFGRLFMNSCNPVCFRRCEELPKKFPVTDEMVKPILKTSLQTAMKEGRIFIVDYYLLENIARYSIGEDIRYVTDPLVLLYADQDGELMPLAIQLHQNPAVDNPIWLPTDEPADWLTAKTWVRCADAQVHQLATHLLNAHFIIEVFALSTKRNLPEIHPIQKLIYPHIRYTIAINSIGRKALVGEGKIADQLMALGGGGHLEYMKQVYNSLKFDGFFLPESLKERGVDCTDTLKHYYYRDDALLHWNAISDYVSQIVDLYYHNDQDVIDDHEIQSWILDAKENGFVIWNDGCDHGVIGEFTSRNELTQWCTMIIFLASVGHAIYNYPQLDIYGFVPLTPLAMHAPPPTTKGEMTEEKLLASLPKRSAVSSVLGLFSSLSNYGPDEIYIGEFPDDHFGEERPREIQSAFKCRLDEISTIIRERNEHRTPKYEYLLPERVPNSITI